MGITRGTISLLAMSIKSSNLTGDAITFGVQGVDANLKLAKQKIKAAGYECSVIGDDDVVIDNITQYGDTIHQMTLFKMLGFKDIHSIDYFPDENPTFTLDLNKPIPSELNEKYDLVFDGGTTEHCFNVPQVMRNAVNLLKSEDKDGTAGMIIHYLPMNKSIDHGFYQFSPTLFFDYYAANGFEDMQMKIHFQNAIQEKYFIYDPLKDKALPFSFGYDSVYIFFSARKKKSLPEAIYPIQMMYRRGFGDLKGVGKKEQKKNTFKELRNTILRKILKGSYSDFMRRRHDRLDYIRIARRVKKMKKNAFNL
jgi:hypothetical protein